MFINPTIAIERGWIKGNINLNNIQPNAIDFTIDRIFKIQADATTTSVITEHGKRMLPQKELLPNEGTYSTHKWYSGAPDEKLLMWKVGPGAWDCMSDMYVELPEGVAAQLVIRSTFNRNGMFLTSGLYDSGFKGHIGFVLHNLSGGNSYVEKGTRVGQIIFVSSDNSGVYAGGWNHEHGTHHTEKTTKKAKKAKKS